MVDDNDGKNIMIKGSLSSSVIFGTLPYFPQIHYTFTLSCLICSLYTFSFLSLLSCPLAILHVFISLHL